MGITDQILADHAARKAHGTTWFTADDLARLGIQDRVMTIMQNVQHTLKLRQATQVVETLGHTDRFCVTDTH